jgi:hypothetical protein
MLSVMTISSLTLRQSLRLGASPRTQAPFWVPGRIRDGNDDMALKTRRSLAFGHNGKVRPADKEPTFDGRGVRMDGEADFALFLGTRRRYA